MLETLEHTLSVLAVLALVGPVVTTTTPGAPAVPSEAGGYEENFGTYTYKDYVENAEWDVWAQAMRLARTDGTYQSWSIIAMDGSGNAFVIWTDARNGQDDIYAQKLDSRGNILWAVDVRVNSDIGAAYQQFPAVAVDRNGNAVVVWEDYRNGATDIYTQKLDGNGTRLWAADVRVNSGSGTAYQRYPAVAVDGSGNVIVAWEDYRNGVPDIYTQKLDGNGTRLWAADARVNSDSGTAYQQYPVVAMDGSGNAVIVWVDDCNGHGNIYAQKMDGNGNWLWAADVQVNSDSSTATQWLPAVAVDGSGHAVVVWEDYRNGAPHIYAQKLDGNGNWLWAADVQVSSEGGTGYQRFPAVAVDRNGNAIVVWDNYRNGGPSIYAQKLDGNGTRLWAAGVQVNSDSGTAYQQKPAVAVNGSGNTIVVWEHNCGGVSDIYAQKLDESGTRLWAADVWVNSDSGTAYQQYPAVAVDGSGNAIVVWEDYRNGAPHIYAQKLDGNGNWLWAADVQVSSEGGTGYLRFPAVAVDRSGNAIVVWEDFHGSASDIYAQKLDGSGNRLWAANVRISSSSGTASQWSPAVAVHGSGEAIVVWHDYRNGDGDIYAQKLDGSGNWLWSTDVRVNFDSGTAAQWLPAVAVDRSGNTVIVWTDERNGDQDIYTQKLDGNGNRLWTTDVRVNSDIGTVNRYSRNGVAIDESGNAIVVWLDERDDNLLKVYAQKLNASGSKLWGTDVYINPDSGASNQDDPAIAVDGSGNAIIVWEDYRNSYGDIYAQKLDDNGSKLWLADTRVNSDNGPTRQSMPTVAIDGSGDAFVAWDDGRNGNPDVFAQRINAVGGKIWLADLQVVYPDRFYLPAGIAQSRSVDTSAGNIVRANLTADFQTNGGGVQFHLTNDDGAHWAQVTPGVAHVFTTTGSDLRWRAVLTTDPVWLRTPVVNSLRIEYSTQGPYADDYEPDDTCAQASPLQVNGAVQAHTFHQPDDEDWAWFDAVSGTTYVLQTAHAGPDADTMLELHDVCDHPILTDTNAFGHDARLLFTASSDSTLYAHVTNQDSSVYGEDTDYDLSVRTYHPNGLAVVVAGHNDAWHLQSNIDYAADQAYLTLLEAGFPRANVRYLGPNPNRDVDGNGLNDDIVSTATITNVRHAIQDWPREQGLALGVPFYVYLMDHGHYDQFLANGSAEKVTAPLLNLWLSNLEATTGTDQITAIIDACKSGSFIDITGPGPAEISGHNRVIVASTTSEANAYPSEQGALFSDVFWTALGDNQSVWSAYQTAKAAVDARGLMQTPWLDDNGDAVADERDGDLARGRGLAGVFGGSEPVIDWLKVGEVSASGTVTVAAQVRDDFKVMGVHVEAYPPGYEEPEAEPGETPVVGVPTTALTWAGSDTYMATLTGLTAPGFYRVVGYAVDDEGNWALPKWVVVEGWGGEQEKVYLPLVLRR